MKNLSKLSLLVVFLSIFISTPVFAAAPTNQATSANGIILATVNINNAKIISQKGNIFNISFSLSNGEGLQTGVKYGIELVQDSTKGQLIVDEKIYDESLTLNPNTTTKKEITYTAPSSLSGSYTLYITSKNSSGFPFGHIPVSVVNLTNNNGLQILPETCLIQTETGKSYSINQRIGIKPEESIKLNCTAQNSLKTDINVTPSYETHLMSSYGNIIETQTKGDTNPISFKANESKSFSVTLPKVTTPSSYNINFLLINKDFKSNSINVNYTVLGASATIENLSLDKDYYNKGDKAQVSFVYITQGLSAITSNIQISNGNGNSCAKEQSQKLTITTNPKVDSSISIKSSCIDPIISLSLTDENGKVLDQKEFKVKTTSEIQKPKFNILYAIIPLILLIIVITYLYIKRKNNPITPITPNTPATTPENSNSVPMSIIFFFIFFSLFTLMPTNKASAVTLSYGGGFVDVSIGIFSGTAGDPFTTGKTIYAYVTANCVYFCPFMFNTVFAASNTGSGSLLTRSELDDLKSSILPTAEAAISPIIPAGYTTIFSVGNLGVNNISGQASFPVQSTPGTYYMNFADSGIFTYSIPYVVASPPATAPATVPTVQVYANTVNPLTTPYDSLVKITWNSQNSTSCDCTYLKNGATTSCGTGTVGDNQGGMSFNLKESTTFNVNCTDGINSTNTSGSCGGNKVIGSKNCDGSAGPGPDEGLSCSSFTSADLCNPPSCHTWYHHGCSWN
ncbi:MAG: hypothetical protein WCW54_00235 [Candidatus Paceibacterota bacterium]